MKYINKILAFLRAKEFTAVLFLVLSMLFAITGSWFFSGIFLGIFIKENHALFEETVASLWNKYVIKKD